MRKTDINILIEAMRILSREIYCEDGIATAAIAEAAAQNPGVVPPEESDQSGASSSDSDSD